MNLLHIDSSITGGASVSRQISAKIVEAVRAQNGHLTLVRRDLGAKPLPHLDGATLMAAMAGSATDPKIQQNVSEGFAVLEEFLAADVIVIGAPMYNFGVSSQLKAWIDRIAIAGKTFRYTANGPEGLSQGKTVIVASSRGGIYAPGSAQAAFDFQENYLRAVFQFLGVDAVHFVRAEGVAIGPEQRDAALNAALQSVENIAKSFAPARAA